LQRHKLWSTCPIACSCPPPVLHIHSQQGHRAIRGNRKRPAELGRSINQYTESQTCSTLGLQAATLQLLLKSAAQVIRCTNLNNARHMFVARKQIMGRHDILGPRSWVFVNFGLRRGISPQLAPARSSDADTRRGRHDQTWHALSLYTCLLTRYIFGNSSCTAQLRQLLLPRPHFYWESGHNWLVLTLTSFMRASLSPIQHCNVKYIDTGTKHLT